MHLNTDLNQKVGSMSSDSYDDEDSEEVESSPSSESEEEDLDADLSPSTDYFFSFETQHKDFVRSMVQY